MIDQWYMFNSAAAVILSVYLFYVAQVLPCRFGIVPKLIITIFALCFGMLGFAISGAIEMVAPVRLALAIVDTVFIAVTWVGARWVYAKVRGD